MSDEGKLDPPQEPRDDGKDGGEAPGNNNEKKSFDTDIKGNVGTLYQGDVKVIHHHVHHHDHYHPIDNTNNKQTDDTDDKQTGDTHNKQIDAIRSKQKKYSAGTNEPAFTPDEKTEEAAKEIPVSTEQLDGWFYRLSDYERCFVLTMAVFHGRRVNNVTDRSKQLYTTFRETVKSQEEQDKQDKQENRISRTELEKRLFITSRRTFGIDRFYWQDTDSNNDSEFSMRLLLYIASEAALNFGASEGYSFNELVKEWVKDNDADIAWRAARALGVSWWQNNTKILENEIETWARSDRDFDWRRAAWSLEGAYKIDCVISKETADDVRHSPVLKKLRDWVIKARDKQNVNLGNTAAITYSFLGRHAPQVGMRGLDTLLELPRVELEQDYQELETLQEVYDAVVFSYCDLALSGHIREILQHLAAYVKDVCYDREHLKKRDRGERVRQELQRDLRVGAAFDFLYWMAEASFDDPKNMRSASYQIEGSLPAKPQFERKDGNDQLLDGILREDENVWRNSISTLLCAALVENKTKLVFLLLRRWAECVMRDQSKQPDNVRKSYVRFMRDLAIQVDTWGHHLQKLDFHVPPVIGTFIKKLEAWKQNSGGSQYVLGLLAQEVLDELPFVDGSLVPSVQKV